MSDVEAPMNMGHGSSMGLRVVAPISLAMTHLLDAPPDSVLIRVIEHIL